MVNSDYFCDLSECCHNYELSWRKVYLKVIKDQVTLCNFSSGFQMPLIGHLSGQTYIFKDKVLKNFLSLVTQKLFT